MKRGESKTPQKFNKIQWKCQNVLDGDEAKAKERESPFESKHETRKWNGSELVCVCVVRCVVCTLYV